MLIYEGVERLIRSVALTVLGTKESCQYQNQTSDSSPRGSSGMEVWQRCECA